DFHPGPNRGVKQGVLAVLTNALMPSVLVEIGYLSNADESRLMSDRSFQRESADALARSVVRFFERYPPGIGSDR
ncbi:MAG: N-acetylmuramoyl-L-alanine amidase, partial [Gemmatimonadota bacterium]|nr:N-acetylmuramoyl-L-alanine amidase [Gemmatimonadota bacterium]